ncbi:MAG: hypothetical protein GXO49_01340 [Chlorobi bacterium]|nr:hypothetical protein [Chlorobiota bacterium]
MAISMIRQKLGTKTFTSYVPAGDEDAKAFADAVMPGEYEILAKTGESGSDSVTESRKWTLMLRNDETHEKTYLTFFAPLSKSSKDIKEALTGKTFNGVKADTIVVLHSRKYQFASNDSSDDGSSS